MASEREDAGHGRRRYCGQPTKSGGSCTRPAGWGTGHVGFGACKFHLGNSPSHVKAAQRQQADALLASLLWDPAAAPVTDSVGEMQRLAGSMRQAVDVLGARLNPGDACEACGRGPEPLDGVVGSAWTRVLRELRTLLADMKRLGIAEYAVNVEATRVKLMAVAFDRALGVLDPPPSVEQRQEATRVLLAELRASAEVSEGGDAA